MPCICGRGISGSLILHTKAIAAQSGVLTQQLKDLTNTVTVNTRMEVVSKAKFVYKVPKIHVRSPSNEWRIGTVVGLKAGEIKVHYDNYRDQFDEWLPVTSERIKAGGCVEYGWSILKITGGDFCKLY